MNYANKSVSVKRHVLELSEEEYVLVYRALERCSGPFSTDTFPHLEVAELVDELPTPESLERSE